MLLRPRASLIVDDMEYPSNAAAQAVWSGTGVTVSSSTTKQEGNYALQGVIDGTGNRSLARSFSLNLSAFKTIRVWERCSASSSAFQFYIKDGSGNESYWDITSHASANTWQQDSLDLTTPDSNNGSNAVLSNITEIGFKGMDALATYIFDTIKAVCGMNVAVEEAFIAGFYQQTYLGQTRITFAGGSSPAITAPSANPRIDLLTLNSAGSLEWTTGTEAASPAEPAFPANKIPICLSRLPQYGCKSHPPIRQLISETRAFLR